MGQPAYFRGKLETYDGGKKSPGWRDAETMLGISPPGIR
jgi:hypothetical protein